MSTSSFLTILYTTQLVPFLSRLTSVVNPHIVLDMDQLVLFFTWPRLLLRGRRGFYRG
jgi:hypothetical protein